MDNSKEDVNVDADADNESYQKPKKKKVALDSEEVLASMPLTDKEKRHKKRLKVLTRQERRNRKRGVLDEKAFEVASAEDDNEEENKKERELKDLQGLSDAKRKKILEARRLIKEGLGVGGDAVGQKHQGGKDNDFEVVSSTDKNKPKPILPIMDERKYNTDEEDYDSDDQARTLALGTMTLRSRSKLKSLVDSSYNRYAWNDPSELPEWFLDDEKRHYRPQLPIPPDLIEKIKAIVKSVDRTHCQGGRGKSKEESKGEDEA